MSKIVDIVLEKKEYVYTKPFHIAHNISTSVVNIEVSVILDSGAKGFGEASPSFRVNGERYETLIHLKDFVKQSIIKKDVKRYRQIFGILDLLKAFPSMKAAIQFAVLDALSEEITIPVYQLLGGSKTEIETDKTVSIGTLEEMIKDSKEILNEGFKIIKVKVGENFKDDIEKIIAIAEATKGASYIIDANTGYTPKEALQFIDSVYKNGVDVALFEQPVAANDIEGLRLVRFYSHYPVAADESVHTKYDALRVIKEEAVDFINIKLMKTGVSDALAIVEMAKTANIGLMLGSMGESSIGINQSVHFATGVGGFTFFDLDSYLMIKEDKFRGKFKKIGPRMIVQ